MLSFVIREGWVCAQAHACMCIYVHFLIIPAFFQLESLSFRQFLFPYSKT